MPNENAWHADPAAAGAVAASLPLDLNVLLARTPAILCMTRGPGHVIEIANDRFRQLAGTNEVVGRRIIDVFPDADPAHIALLDAVYQSGEPRTGTEVAAEVDDGSGPGLRWFDFVYQPLPAADGRPAGVLSFAVDVSEQVRARRLAEERSALLDKANERLALAAEAGRLGAWEWDVRTGRVTWSAELERIHGLEPGTFPGTFEAYQRDIHPEDAEYVLRAISRSVQERQPHRHEYRNVLPDGQIRWVEARGRLFLDADGEPERLIGFCMDVTERKGQEHADLQETRVARLLGEIGLALTRTAPPRETLQACAEAVVTHVNAAFARIWTLDEGQNVLVLQASAGLYTHTDGPHGRVPVGKFKIGLIAQERRPHLTNTVVGDPRVGDQAWAKREGMVAFAGYPLMVGDRLVGVMAMFSKRRLTSGDLEALGAASHAVALGIHRRRSEEVLRDQEERLRAALEASATGTFFWDVQTNALDWDDNLDRLFGLTPGETPRRLDQFTALVHPEDLPGVLHAIEACVSTGADFEREFRVIWPDGSVHWLLDRGRMARDAAGRPLHMVGACVDITRRKAMDADLAYQRDLMKTITDNAGSALFMIDSQGYPAFVNPAALRMTGYESLDEIKGRPLHYAVHFRKPDGSPYPMEECPIDRANAEVVPLQDQRAIFCRKDGTLFPVAYNVAPLSRAGVRQGAVIEVRDISAELEAARALQERAEELARLASALARSNAELDAFAYAASHDLRAPLRGIGNLAQWIEEDLTASGGLKEDTRDMLRLMRGRMVRMESLIEGILEYSRAGRVQTKAEQVDAGRLVQEVVDLLAPSPDARITVAGSLPVLRTERMPLQRVFLNLIGNALKHAQRQDPEVRVECHDAGEFWEFAVTDNGPGIPPEYHERIWGIFQTLEARDRVEGAGIGLALVRKLVEARGGRAWVESDPGAGASFRFLWRKQAG